MQYIYYYNPYLNHHGIKGQKWGVRRTPAQLGYGPSRMARFKNSVVGGGGKVISAVKTARKNRVESEKRKISAKTPLHELSDQELKRRIERMNLEIQYKERLSSTGRLKGHENVKKIFGDTAVDLSKATLKYFGGKLINNMFEAEVVKVGKTYKEIEEEKKLKQQKDKKNEGEEKPNKNKGNESHEQKPKKENKSSETSKKAMKAASKKAKEILKKSKKKYQDHRNRTPRLPDNGSTQRSIYGSLKL